MLVADIPKLLTAFNGKLFTILLQLIFLIDRRPFYRLYLVLIRGIYETIRSNQTY